jgi:transposase
MHNGGFSHRRVADHFRVNHSIIVRLMQRVRQTGNVTDRPRAGRPRKTTPREDRLISRRVRQRPFSTAGVLRGNLAFGGHISTRTVIRRLHHQGMRPQLTLRHRQARFDWSHDHLGWVDYSHMETKHFISGQPHFGHNCFWGWGCNYLGLFFL